MLQVGSQWVEVKCSLNKRPENLTQNLDFIILIMYKIYKLAESEVYLMSLSSFNRLDKFDVIADNDFYVSAMGVD